MARCGSSGTRLTGVQAFSLEGGFVQFLKIFMGFLATIFTGATGADRKSTRWIRPFDGRLICSDSGWRY